MKKLFAGALTLVALSGCATLTEDAMTPVTLTFSDGSNGQCNLENKRGAWQARKKHGWHLCRAQVATYDSTPVCHPHYGLPRLPAGRILQRASVGFP